MFKKVDTYALRAVHHVFKSMACSLIQFFTSRSSENEYPGSAHPFFFDNSISQSIEIRVFHGFSLHLPSFHWVFSMGFPQLHGVSPCFPRDFPGAAAGAAARAGGGQGLGGRGLAEAGHGAGGHGGGVAMGCHGIHHGFIIFHSAKN